MYKRYQGNSGTVRRVEESEAPPPRPAPLPMRPPQPPPSEGRNLLASLGRLLPGLGEELESEDLLLLLILYLMYRETGDSDLLLVMGGMFLL